MPDPFDIAYSGQPGGHYESIWIRANAPDRPRAVWLRFTIFSPRGTPDEALGEVWAMWFDREAGPPVAVRMPLPFGECRFEGHPLDLAVGSATLTTDATSGRVELGGHAISWDLSLSGGTDPIWLLPQSLYGTRLPKAKTVVVLPSIELAGTVNVDGDTAHLDAWPGSLNHNWGSAHTDHYAYGQVAGFDGHSDSFLEVATARVKVGRWWTPFSTLLVLRHEGREYGFRGPLRGMRSKASFTPERWTFQVKDRTVTIEGEITARRTDLIAVPYLDPPGGVRHCVNTKIADASLMLHERRLGRSTQLRCIHRCVLETLPVDLDHGIPLAF